MAALFIETIDPLSETLPVLTYIGVFAVDPRHGKQQC